MAQLIRKGANGDSEVLELNLGLNRFGRHPDSHFPINHKTISAFHAEIVLSAEGVLADTRINSWLRVAAADRAGPS